MQNHSINSQIEEITLTQYFIPSQTPFKISPVVPITSFRGKTQRFFPFGTDSNPRTRVAFVLHLAVASVWPYSVWNSPIVVLAFLKLSYRQCLLLSNTHTFFFPSCYCNYITILVKLRIKKSFYSVKLFSELFVLVHLLFS